MHLIHGQRELSGEEQPPPVTTFSSASILMLPGSTSSVKSPLAPLLPSHLSSLGIHCTPFISAAVRVVLLFYSRCSSPRSVLQRTLLKTSRVQGPEVTPWVRKPLFLPAAVANLEAAVLGTGSQQREKRACKCFTLHGSQGAVLESTRSRRQQPWSVLSYRTTGEASTHRANLLP